MEITIVYETISSGSNPGEDTYDRNIIRTKRYWHHYLY
jgi:hypothetical protein